MPLESILDAIRLETDAEIERIRAEADERVEAILQGARERALLEEESAASSRDADAALAENRIVNGARLEVERALRHVRAEVYGEVLDHVRARLSGVRDGEEYPALLRRLLEEAKAAIPVNGVVRIDPRDTETMAGLLGSQADELKLEPVLDTWGGLDLATPEGVVVRNTLEARLERAGPEMRRLAVELVPELGAGP